MRSSVDWGPVRRWTGKPRSFLSGFDGRAGADSEPLRLVVFGEHP